jgi:hypothetical protein
MSNSDDDISGKSNLSGVRSAIPSVKKITAKQILAETLNPMRRSSFTSSKAKLKIEKTIKALGYHSPRISI